MRDGMFQHNETSHHLYMCNIEKHMQKFLDINGVKTILDIIDEKIEKQDIPTIWKGTKEEYEAIEPKDPDTLYLIKED